jgi:putative redox protein
VELTAYWEGGYRVRVPVRGFEVIADEPVRVGGTDAGPTPTELLLSSLAVCFTMAVYHAFHKRDVEPADLAVRVFADYEGLRFSKIRVVVHSTHPREEIEAVLPRAIGYCYVSNTLASAPEIEYSVAPGGLTPPHAPPPS